MKKKNQELEKFKFVLDYKIKELRKQIEPRENDIKAMKDQIQEVCMRSFALLCYNCYRYAKCSMSYSSTVFLFVAFVFCFSK